MHRSARVRCRQADQGQEAAYSRRYAGSIAARHRAFRRHPGSRWRHPVAGHAVRSVSIPREAVCRQRLSRPDFCERARRNPASPRNRNRQTIRSRQRIRAIAQALDRDRSYNVAKPGFEWSSFIERRGRSRQLLLVAVSRDRQASQFVTGDSASSQDLMRHRRLTGGSPADGGAHGPAHGSPSAASARIVRSDKVRSAESDRGLYPSCADGAAYEPAIETRGCAIGQSENRNGGSGR
jgi:hypothetical protein